MRFSQILLSCVLLLASSTAWSEIKRIEPPFWWAGMQSRDLQLMVYGDDVGRMTVRSDDQDVTIKSAQSLDNANYLFVDLELAPNFSARTISLHFDNGASTISRDYEFRAREVGSAQRRGFAAKDVIYLVTPDRFANGDPNNDSLETLFEKVDRSNPDGRHGGDLLGLTQALGYLQDLGITQIWLNPLQENNQEKYSYHGYSISDLYNIDARFGGNEALLNLSAKAHELGIGLIMDTIPNHIGLNHWWMRDLPAVDWINSNDEYRQTTHRRETIQDPHASEGDKRAFNDGWFVPTMPDLNQNNEMLARYLIQNNIWWIEYANLSGLRVDTLPYGDKHFTGRFNRAILAEYPALNIVGEEWSTNPAIVSYWQRGKLNLDGFEADTPSLMDFPLQDVLIRSIQENEAWNSGLVNLYSMVANDFQYPEPNNLVVIGDNHDMSRLFSQVGEDYRLYKMALTFLMTTRGIPQLFYGTEILMSNPGTDKHGVIRSDFPGGWPGDSVNGFTGRGLSRESQRAQAFVRKLLNWRKNNADLMMGELTHFAPLDGVYVYFRHDEEDAVMVVLNNNKASHSLDLSRFASLLKPSHRLRDVFTNQTHASNAQLKLAAKSANLFALEPKD